MFDPDQFEERAAIMEHDGGMSRFQAETQAARAQGVQRWEALGHVAKRVVEQKRDQREAMAQRAGENDMPGVQRGASEEKRSVPERQRG